ncbi:pep-cterm sorting domain-containing protein [Anaeramoeba ignava]|uniref:Pep-cterm sorting domain-containing protein n=1 Tax=Anaeramoeba ignava TaxID=1746090 RepID=A0A9Q0L792_ANAIG|nr:pep-cterm sorting domain-containing protein [Anaeramoeba ignava]
MENYLNLEKLSNDLKNLFQNQNHEESYFDFEIICEQNQTSFKTHKSILSSRSHYFKSLFNSKMKEFQENKLILKDFSSPIISSILNYFYSGKIEINSENVVEILIFSSKYLIDELTEFSSNFIKNNLQFEIVVDVLKLSESMNFKILIDSCYQFIFDNFDEFIKTPFFLELEENHLNSILSNDYILINEFEILQSLIKWGKHKININKENKNFDKQEKEQFQNQISNAIKQIRFIDFTKKELETILEEDLISRRISQTFIEFQILKNQKLESKLKEFLQKHQEEEQLHIFKPRIRFKSEIIQEKEHLILIREWINDEDFFSKMKKGFSAKKDGFSAKSFHDKCDNQGKTLFIIKTKDNFIFGGFTQVGWISGRGISHMNDSHSFLFSIKNPTNDEPQKFPIKEGCENIAVWYNPERGPAFGGYCDICLDENLTSGWSQFGNAYKVPDGITPLTYASRCYLAGSYSGWKVDELECFFI